MDKRDLYLHWWIREGPRDVSPTSLSDFFHSVQFLAKFLTNNRLARRPHQGNPGSVTDLSNIFLLFSVALVNANYKRDMNFDNTNRMP